MINRESIEQKVASYRLNRYYRQLGYFFQSTESRAYTMLILSFLTMSLFGYFAIRPTLVTVFTLKRQISDATLVSDQLQEKINNLAKAQKNYDDNESGLALVNSALPAKTEFPSFVKILDNIASKSGSAIDELSFATVDISKADTKFEPKKENVNFNLILHGTYSNLMNFIKYLSNSQRIVIVDKIGLNKQDTTTLNLTLSGEIFYVK